MTIVVLVTIYHLFLVDIDGIESEPCLTLYFLAHGMSIICMRHSKIISGKHQQTILDITSSGCQLFPLLPFKD